MLLFIDDLSSTLAGTEQHLLFLAAQLPTPPLRLALAVFSGCDARYSAGCRLQPVLLGEDARRGIWGAIQKIRRLAALISHERIDVVHAFCPLSELLAVVATRLARRGRVLGVRRNTGYWHTRLTLWRSRLASALHVQLAANCEAARQFTIGSEWTSPNRISVIRNPVSLKRREEGLNQAVARETLGIQSNQPIVGIVANVRPVKDFATFLRACSHVQKRFPDAHFLIAGGADPSYLVRMKELARALKLEQCVTWLGAVDNPFSILPLCDVGVLSSCSEGFSNTLLEYAAAGIPAVATDVGGTKEIIVDGETGYIVPPKAPERLAERVCHLLDNRELRRRLGDQARRRVERTFGERRVIQQYCDLYAKVAAGERLQMGASATTLVFHGIVATRGDASLSLDRASVPYAVELSRFSEVLNAINPEKSCTVSELLTKAVDRWTVLTFDDGLASDYSHAFGELQSRALRATFFVTVSNVDRPGYLSAAQLREMSQAGMEIASHGLTHRYLVSMTRREATREIRESKRRLEELLGREVTAFAPVGGHYSNWMVSEAAAAGFRAFATMVPGHTSLRHGLLLLRRNHLKAQHSTAYATRLLTGPSLASGIARLRYELLRLPKIVLGMRAYDALKGLTFSLAPMARTTVSASQMDATNRDE